MFAVGNMAVGNLDTAVVAASVLDYLDTFPSVLHLQGCMRSFPL